MTTDVVTARLETTYKRLVEKMLDRRVSGVPVVDDDGRLLGIVTEADLVDKQAYGNAPEGLLGMLRQVVFGPPSEVAEKAWALTAGGLMTADVHTATPDEDVTHAARRLLEHNFKRLPVVTADGLVVGIVSRRDLLAAFARSDEQIAGDVRRTLADPLAVPEDARIEDIHVRDGRVVLRGSVDRPSDVDVVSAAVRRVPGVITVESQLFARRPEPQLSGPLVPPLR
jgi:CBS domain-containing protein